MKPTIFTFSLLAFLFTFSTQGFAQKEESKSNASHQRQLRVESTTSSAGQQVTVNIRVDAVGDESGYGFTLNYDASVLTLPSASSTSIGTAGGRRNCNLFAPGELRCVVKAFPDDNPMSSTQAGEINAGDNQLLFTARFNVAASAQPGTTNLTLTNANASNDSAQSLVITSQNGTVSITAPTAAGVFIVGRVMTESGRGIKNVSITLTDANGHTRTTQTSAFGYYRFDDVAAGETVTLSAKARRYRFNLSSIVRTTNESINDSDFVSEQ